MSKVKLQPFSRSNETKKAYRERTVALINKARKELQIPSYKSISVKQFVGWLCAYKDTLSYSSWKQYKSSVLDYLEDQILLNHKDINDFIESYELLKNQQQTAKAKSYVLKNLPIKERKQFKETSMKKMKDFPIKDFTAITMALEQGSFKQAKFSEELLSWLFAGILTGLRPIEWQSATIEKINGQDALIVKNAKNSNGRAHGEFRTIHLKMLSKEEKRHIFLQVQNAHYWAGLGKYKYFTNSCAALLKKVGEKVLKGNGRLYPCLYSLRHQFSADLKASGFSREEIAALMGHAVDDTATIHYAKKRSGANFSRVIPEQAEVLKIRQSNRFNYTPEQSLTLENTLENQYSVSFQNNFKGK